MNLTAILADLYRRLALPATPNVTETTRLTSFVNTTHRQILGLPGLESLRDDTMVGVSQPESALVVHAKGQGLFPNITRLEGVTDCTSGRALSLLTLKEMRARDPMGTMTGTPDSYVIRGYQQVEKQPSVPCMPHVTSTNPADMTTTVYLEVIHQLGGREQCVVTLNGLTPVRITDYGDVIEITKFYLGAPSAGYVSLYQEVALTSLLAAIRYPSTYARYLAVMFHPIPSASNTYNFDYVRTVDDMINGTDEPLLPDDFHWLLVEGSLMKEWTKRDDDRRVAAEREYAKGISALKYFVNCHADLLSVSGRRTTWPASRYGPYYPTTRY